MPWKGVGGEPPGWVPFALMSVIWGALSAHQGGGHRRLDPGVVFARVAVGAAVLLPMGPVHEFCDGNRRPLPALNRTVHAVAYRR